MDTCISSGLCYRRESQSLGENGFAIILNGSKAVLWEEIYHPLTLLPVKKQTKTKQTWKMDQVKSDQGLEFFVHSARVCRNPQGPWWIVSLNVWKAVTETSLISHLKDYLEKAL